MTRKTRAAFAAFAIMLPSALADAQDVAVQNVGYKVGETAFVHPTVGATAGVVNNVFFQNESDKQPPITTGVLRLHLGVAVHSDTLDESAEVSAKQLSYQFGGNLGYTEYLSSNEAARDQRAVSGDLNAGITLRPSLPLSFYGTDTLHRHARPPNFETSGTLIRYINRLKLGMQWRPPGRVLSGLIEYQNTIDVFEDRDLDFADRVQHQFRARAEWRYLPITLFYAQATQGIYASESLLTNSMYQSSSFPLSLRIGMDSAITELTTLKLHAGWSAGFFSEGASYNSAIYGGQFGYRYSPLGRLYVGMNRRFNDSLNANFYGDYEVSVGTIQQIAAVTVNAKATYIHRNYQGLPDDIVPITMDERSDSIFDGQIDAHYHIRQWFAALAYYKFSAVNTDFRYNPDISDVGSQIIEDDPSYTRHEFVLGVRAAL